MHTADQKTFTGSQVPFDAASAQPAHGRASMTRGSFCRRRILITASSVFFTQRVN
jgi:hypothetical protein